MPPAFNLSQDQTLQFNLCKLTLGIEVTFDTSISMSVWSKDLKSCDSGLRLPNTHAYRLLIFKEHLLTCCQHRSEIITRFPLCCQAPWQTFLHRFDLFIEARSACLGGASQHSPQRVSAGLAACSPLGETKAPAEQGLCWSK